jgi:hypothetical protein
VKGPLEKKLQELPADAIGVLLGALPGEIRQEFTRTPLGVAPNQVALDLTKAKAGQSLLFRFRGTMDNEADAKRLVDAIKELLRQGEELLKTDAAGSFTPMLKDLLKTIQAVEWKTEGTNVSAELPLTPATHKTLLSLVDEIIKKEAGR